jgi:hypothetical protein
MRHLIPLRLKTLRAPVLRASALAAFLAAAFFPAIAVTGQQPVNNPRPPRASGPLEPKGKAVKPAAGALQKPAQLADQQNAAAPTAPVWPVNRKAQPAHVTWDSHGLKIEASNSSLDQILHEVSLDTGVKVEGFSKDQRIFGTYGPGPAREVLSRLLDGSGYNVLMLGGVGNAPPTRIVLSTEGPSGPQPPHSAQDEQQAEEDTPEPEEQQPQDLPPPPPPAPMPIPQETPQPTPIRNPFGGQVPMMGQAPYQQQQQQQEQQQQEQQQQQQQQQ